MKKSFLLKFALIGLFIVSFTPACTDLEEEIFDQVTSDNFFNSDEEFISALGAAYTSLYGYMGTTGIYAAQEVSSDALVVPTRGPDWDDGGHWRRLHQHIWNSEDPTVGNTWNSLFGGINSCNRLIFQFEELANPSTDPFIAELKSLRAFFYLLLLDMYGNVPIVTQFAGGDPTPPTNSRQEVFSFVERELLDALNNVPTNVDLSTYGRMNQMVVRVCLAKLYLNAEVYTGTPQWSKAVDFCNAIIDDPNNPYDLERNYFANFNIDNSASKENIFVVPYDAVFAGGFNIVMQSLSYINQQTYNLAAQPWNGWCTVEEFFNSYEDDDLRKGMPNTEDGPSGVRGNFLWGAQWGLDGTRLIDAGFEAGDPDGANYTLTPELNELGPNCFRQAGARIAKFEFEIGGQPDMSNDFPIYRYADVLLMKAEALWRQNPSDPDALAIVNQIRDRAGVALFTELTADNLLAERGRELFVECHRRSDLIRFGKFGDPWWEKGASEECRELFPIPRSQTDANPNLTQNPCY